jgi:hypothetical protein
LKASRKLCEGPGKSRYKAWVGMLTPFENLGQLIHKRGPKAIPGPNNYINKKIIQFPVLPRPGPREVRPHDLVKINNPA